MIEDLPGEIWKPVRNSNNYMISTRGRLKNLPYLRRNGQGEYLVKSSLQKPFMRNRCQAYALNLDKVKNAPTAKLMYEAFIGDIPRGMYACVKPGDEYNIHNIILVKKGVAPDYIGHYRKDLNVGDISSGWKILDIKVRTKRLKNNQIESKDYLVLECPKCNTIITRLYRYEKENHIYPCPKCTYGHIYKHPMQNTGRVDYRNSLYLRWSAIIHRCHKIKENKSSYRVYRGKSSAYNLEGIRVCKLWRESFESFYEWSVHNGYKQNLSIDRIDPDGDYAPYNCQWITKSENVGKMTKDKRRKNNSVAAMLMKKDYFRRQKKWLKEMEKKGYSKEEIL